MPPKRDLTGQQFEKLLVLRLTEKKEKLSGNFYHTVKCDCGTIFDIVGSSLGRTKSCGYSKRKYNTYRIFPNGEVLVELTKKQWTVLLADDWLKLKKYKWFANFAKNTNSYYCFTWQYLFMACSIYLSQ